MYAVRAAAETTGAGMGAGEAFCGVHTSGWGRRHRYDTYVRHMLRRRGAVLRCVFAAMKSDLFEAAVCPFAAVLSLCAVNYLVMRAFTVRLRPLAVSALPARA